jgi:hypothetical protein
LYRKGDPVQDEKVQATLKNVADPKYQERGASQLTPRQLRRLREALLNTNTLDGLAPYTQIILGCKLFARQDEMHQMEVKHFVPEHFVRRRDGRVDA